MTALLWPDLDDVRARNALSKAIHHLRRALGKNALIVRGNEAIGINREQIWCDACAFDDAISNQRYKDALDLYRRGPLMEGFALPETGEFEQWLESERRRVRQKAIAAATSLANAAEREGDFAGAVTWARMACELSPHDETVLRRLILALARTGDRAGALKAYQSFSDRLARDLEIEPSSETKALADSLRIASTNGSPKSNGPTPFTVTQIPPPVIAGEPEAVAKEIEPRTQRKILVSGIALAGIAAVGGFFFMRNSETARALTPKPGIVAIGSVRNRTGDAGLNSVAQMATGNIVQQLSQSGQVGVVELRGAQTAESTGADKVVRGDMYRKDDSVFVQMQIVDAKDGRVLQQLDPVGSPLMNAYSLLDRIRDGVTGAVAALADTLYLPWTTAHSRPPKYAAFQEFMQGLDAIVNQSPPDAVGHLKKAIALDTSFVEAKIWLLEQADGLPGQQRLIDSVKVAAMAQREKLGAFDQVALDRELAFLAGHWEEVYTASRRLAAIAPETPDAQLYLAHSAVATRRYTEAIAVLHHIDRSKGWLKNFAPITFWDLQAHRLNGDAASAVAEWRRARARDPQDFGICNSGVMLIASLGREQLVDSVVATCANLPSAPPSADRAWELAGRGYRSRGYLTEAKRAFERSAALRAAAAAKDPRRRRGLGLIECELGNWKDAFENLSAAMDTSNADDRVALAVAAAHLGDTATVNRTLRWISEWKTRENPRGADSQARALVVLAMGKKEEALSLLQRAIREGSAPAWNAWYVRFELGPLRGDPRFEQLVRPQT
ncbi:MAG: BTAD domain-containing putative transcriptional regulator [Gemmatimonadaceae bacterium]